MREREAKQVRADELEQAGDARSELLRAEATGRDTAALIAARWSEWVGRLDPAKVLCRWSWGNLVDLAIAQAPTDWTPRELPGRPVMEGLVRLALGPGVSRDGVETLEGLPHLALFGGGLTARVLGVESLTVDLPEGGFRELERLEAPSLQALHTRCPLRDEVTLVRGLAQARGFPALQRWTHRFASAEGVLALLEHGPWLLRGGEGLVVLAEAPVLRAVPARVREALPRAQLVELPGCPRPGDPDDSNGPREQRVVPRSAPTNFRALPAKTTQSLPSMQSEDKSVTTVGSGFTSPYLDAPCGWCGSKDTRLIWETSWSSYSHFESTTYRRWEYECRGCGLFNTMQDMRTR